MDWKECIYKRNSDGFIAICFSIVIFQYKRCIFVPFSFTHDFVSSWKLYQSNLGDTGAMFKIWFF